MVSPIVRKDGDIFKNNYDYLCAQSRKALFALKSRLINASPTPPTLMLKLFDATVKPILTFGSDIWGLNSVAQDKIDVFHRAFLKHLLCVKTSTCNSFVYGETGCFPLSIDLSAFTYRFFHRLINLPKTTLAKYVFDEMMRLSNLGFNSWVTKVHQSLTEIGLNDSLSLPVGKFKILCYSKLREKYICDCSKYIHPVHSTRSSSSQASFSGSLSFF